MSETNEEQITSLSNTPKDNNQAKIISIVVVIVLVIASVIAFQNGLFSTSKTNNETTTELEEGSTATVAARVNGVAINSTYVDNQAKAFITSSLPPGTTEVPAELETEARNQALQVLINQEILYQTATNSGVEVTVEDLQSQMDDIIGRFPSVDEYKAALATDGLTEEGLREDIRKQLVVQKYVDTVVNIEEINASEEEIQALYDKYSAVQENMPELEEIQEQLKAEIIQGKFNTQIGTIIDQLLAEANVEIL